MKASLYLIVVSFISPTSAFKLSFLGRVKLRIHKSFLRVAGAFTSLALLIYVPIY